MSRAFALALVLSFVTLTRTSAQDPSSCIQDLSAAEVDVRIRTLDTHFQANKRRARAHWYGYMSLFAALGVGQVIFATQTDEQVARFSNIVGATGAFLTAAQMAVLPNTAAIAPQRFRRHPDSTLEERRLKLRYGLELMELSSNRALRGSGPGAHIVPLLWSATWSTVIMLKFDSPLTVLRLVGGGILVSESRILLKPHDSVRSWERIRGSFCGGSYLHRYTPMEMDEMLPADGDEDEPDDYVDDYEEDSVEEPRTVTTGGVTMSGVYFLHTF